MSDAVWITAIIVGGIIVMVLGGLIIISSMAKNMPKNGNLSRLSRRDGHDWEERTYPTGPNTFTNEVK